MLQGTHQNLSKQLCRTLRTSWEVQRVGDPLTMQFSVCHEEGAVTQMAARTQAAASTRRIVGGEGQGGNTTRTCTESVPTHPRRAERVLLMRT